MMGFYTYPACGKCNQFMQKTRSDVAIQVGVHKGHFHADFFRCPVCKCEVLMEWAEQECFANCEIEMVIP